MSFQAYLDNISVKTGKTTEKILQELKSNDFDKNTKATEIINFLKEKYDLGRGHSMAIIYIIKNGNSIKSKKLITSGKHADKNRRLNIK